MVRWKTSPPGMDITGKIDLVPEEELSNIRDYAEILQEFKVAKCVAGIRLDGGTAYSGSTITPYYDSLLVKITAWAPSFDQVIPRMDRALREFRERPLELRHRLLVERVSGLGTRHGDRADPALRRRQHCLHSRSSP